jgi:serine/threonine-protein kinase ATR
MDKHSHLFSFRQGLTLPKPEVVPFRLTPNMIDAFGPVGADGIFTSSLKDAMSTLRDNRDTLLSVLEPFVRDPVIDWKRSRTQQKATKVAEERQSREAKRSIKVIDERLQGIYNLRNPNFKKVRRTDKEAEDVDSTSHLVPLSVEGQVHKMMAEATSHENLVQLYVGWMPWV